MDAGIIAAQPTNAGQQLLARLEQPETVAALNRLLDRLDVIVLAADAADGFLRRGDVMTDSVADGIAELRQIPVPAGARQLADHLPQLARTGLQVADLASDPATERVLSSGLLQRLGDPTTLAAIHGLLNHLELASFGLEAIDGFLRRGDEITDAVTDSLADLTKLGSSMDVDRIKELVQALPVIADLATQVVRSGLLNHAKTFVDTLNALHSTGVFAPDAVAVVGEVSAAARTAREKKEYAADAPKGVFGLLGALRDPDVQASLGFAIAFARNYGQRLKADSH